jgi:hypothetical protein
MGAVMTNHGARRTTAHQARVSKFTGKSPEGGHMESVPCAPCAPWSEGNDERPAESEPYLVLPRPITREGLTEQLIETYEWALTLGHTDAAVDAVLGIAELNGLQIDSVEVQSEVQATLVELRKVEK